MSVRAAFLDQARYCDNLGSPFTAQVLCMIAEGLRPDGRVAERLLTWPGDVTHAGDSVPLRTAGGFHALVLARKDQRLAALYPPNSTPADVDLSDALFSAFKTHETFFLDWLQSPPQTNEVARSAPLIAAGRYLDARFGLPLSLLELGASAGLNLQWDRYALRVDGEVYGPDDAPLVLSPNWTGAKPEAAEFEIAARAGVDFNPIDATNPQHRLRLKSYIWPDQPERLARMQRALDLAASYPVQIDQGDAIYWLAQRLAEPRDGVVTVIYHTVAWQYFPKDVQAKGEALICKAGNNATANAPLVHLAMEADGNQPGAALSMDIWPGGARLNLGRTDFHGRWVSWKDDGI